MYYISYCIYEEREERRERDMSIKQNANASIWEVIPFFALRKMFPQLKWSNEYLLREIEANSNIDVTGRRYDIYSPVLKAAVEVSRIGAHNSFEHLTRDRIKQQFSNDARVKLFHIRQDLCVQDGFTNVHTFTIGKNTNDINFPIRTLCNAIEETAIDIERTFCIRRLSNVNYGNSIGEILALYKRITGKTFNEEALELSNLSEKKKSENLGLPFDNFQDFAKRRNISSNAAYCDIEKNKTKYVANGNFLAKNVNEALIANEVLNKKDKEIEDLKNMVNILSLQTKKIENLSDDEITKGLKGFLMNSEVRGYKKGAVVASITMEKEH